MNRNPWDMIPEMRQRSFEHLSKVAASVVSELLGPSPQEAEARAADAYYEQALERYRLDLHQHGSVGYSPPVRPERVVMTDAELDAWLKRRIQERLLTKIDALLMDLIGIESSSYGNLRMKSGSSPLGQRLTDKAKQMAITLADEWVEKNKDFVIFRSKNPEHDQLAQDIRFFENRLEKSYRAYDGGVAVQQDRAHLEAQIASDREQVDTLKKRLAEMGSRTDGLNIEDVFRHFRQDLEGATRAAVTERIKVIALDRAKMIRQDVLEAAVDKAMYDTYPILRRTEAISRLGAKAEDAV